MSLIMLPRKGSDMQRTLIACLLVCALGLPLAAQEAKATKVPRWDASGVGKLPRMGITSLDVSDDGKEIVVGTIAAFGDPNVIVLDDAGKIVRTYKVGQQWIDNVAFVAGSKDVLAICTMPAGRAGATGSGANFSGGATRPSRSSLSALVRCPARASRISTRGKSGAYLSLKLRLPATRVAPLAVASAPVPRRTRRANSLSTAPGIANHA